MSDAIGPGDWVERVRPDPRFGVGSAWLILSIFSDNQGGCDYCGATVGLILLDDPVSINDAIGDGWRHGGWCPCGFRPYQGPEQTPRLTSEPTPADREGVMV